MLTLIILFGKSPTPNTGSIRNSYKKKNVVQYKIVIDEKQDFLLDLPATAQLIKFTEYIIKK